MSHGLQLLNGLSGRLQHVVVRLEQHVPVLQLVQLARELRFLVAHGLKRESKDLKRLAKAFSQGVYSCAFEVAYHMHIQNYAKSLVEYHIVRNKS